MSNFTDLGNLEQFCQEHPDSIVFAFLASRYLENGQIERARQTAEAGVNKHPGYAFGHFILGKCYHRINELSKAKTQFELALAYDDKNPLASKLLGEINQQLELPIMAQESFLLYHILDPFHAHSAAVLQQLNWEDITVLDDIEPQEDSTVFEDISADKPGGRDEDLGLDDFFDSDSEIQEDFDVSRKVEEVFKDNILDEVEKSEEDVDLEDLDKTFGELDLLEFGDEQLPEEASGEKEAAEPQPPAVQNPPDKADDDISGADEFKILDELTEDAPRTTTDTGEDELNAFWDQTDLEEPLVADEEVVEDVFDTVQEPSEEASGDSDIMVELDEFFAEYEKDAAAEQPADSEQTEETADFADYLFDDETEKPVEKTAGEDNTFNYSSLVDDLVSNADDSDDLSELEDVFDLTGDTPDQGDDDISAPPGSRSGAEDKPRFGRTPLLSPTLGEIYISQGRFEEALDVFRQLLKKDPDNKRFQKKIRDVQGMIDKQQQ